MVGAAVMVGEEETAAVVMAATAVPVPVAMGLLAVMVLRELTAEVLVGRQRAAIAAVQQAATLLALRLAVILRARLGKERQALIAAPVAQEQRRAAARPAHRVSAPEARAEPLRDQSGVSARPKVPQRVRPHLHPPMLLMLQQRLLPPKGHRRQSALRSARLGRLAHQAQTTSPVWGWLAILVWVMLIRPSRLQ